MQWQVFLWRTNFDTPQSESALRRITPRGTEEGTRRSGSLFEKGQTKTAKKMGNAAEAPANDQNRVNAAAASDGFHEDILDYRGGQSNGERQPPTSVQCHNAPRLNDNSAPSFLPLGSTANAPAPVSQ
ncbi:unnamed protein product [Calicophoron daubneyi]|uniref:Uncharacterized protein n=1 Tax=Calicophoron daubneyi TaxID=300641 RepID=A0AAV2TD97_CALDB